MATNQYEENRNSLEWIRFAAVICFTSGYSPSRTRKPLAFRHGMKVRLDKECTINRKVCGTLSIQNVGIFYLLFFIFRVAVL
ncbi:hypothetical protein [Bacillus cereus group sp. BfR-BA-01345]|uniref:hypothetical protein n=1 Tax=Bacillus cereus group sp. BfR-BA-01345 TaxID=2920308 RepID=UPI001F5AC803